MQIGEVTPSAPAGKRAARNEQLILKFSPANASNQTPANAIGKRAYGR